MFENWHRYYDTPRPVPDMRRRIKKYPSGNSDEFFYGSANALLVDRGVDTLFSPINYYTTDEYIWLGGQAVAVVRGRFSTGWARASDASTTCGRNGESTDCGIRFPINDYLGKHVLMLDASRRVAGTGEYDPFGHVNRMSVTAATAHFHGWNVNTHILDTRLPEPAGLVTDYRIRFHHSSYEVGCGANIDQTWVEDGDNSSTLAQVPSGEANYVTGWVDPAGSWLKVGFSSGACHATPFFCDCLGPVVEDDGVTVEAIEFRRRESSATPFWTPLRFPGHYYDAETDLFENWHRYYDPSIGRYLEAEPLLSDSPGLGPAYAYAENNPINFLDPDGYRVIVLGQQTLTPIFAQSDAELRQTGLVQEGRRDRAGNTYPVTDEVWSLDNKCKPYTDECGNEKWHFDATFTTNFQTAYNAAQGRGPDSTIQVPRLWGGVLTLGQHEGLHVEHFRQDLANPTTRRGLEVGTEGFSSYQNCERARQRWERDGRAIYERYLQRSAARSASRIDLYGGLR